VIVANRGYVLHFNPFMGALETAEQRTTIQQYGDDCLLMLLCLLICYIWYSKEGHGRVAILPSPLLDVPNVTVRVGKHNCLEAPCLKSS